MKKLLSLFLAVALATAASPIARWMKGDPPNNLKTDADLPGDLLNSFIRTRKNSFYPKNGGKEFDAYASGVVVKTQLDEKKNEGYIWIATADHVVAPRKAENGENPMTSLYIGFGNGDTDKNKPITPVEKVFRGPIIGGKRADIAIIRYFADNLLKLPDKLQAIPIGGWSGDKKNVVVMAGSGDYAKSADAEEWLYNVTTKDSGVLRRGINTIDEAVVNSFTDQGSTIEYKYQSLKSKLDFQFDEKGKAYSADAYFLGSDSGGATLEKSGDKWNVVGIHSVSEGSQVDPTKMKDGYKQWDANIGHKDYAEWLKQSLAPVPEPTSLLAFGLGLAATALAKRARKRP